MNSGEFKHEISDYSDGVPPRAFGTETEYTDDSGVENLLERQNYGSRSRQLTSYVPAQYLVSPGRRIMSSAVTTNGGEMYLDNNALEYATPECASPEETVLHERLGEQMVHDTIMRIGASLDRPPKVYKRSGYVEVWGGPNKVKLLLQETSIGHHESYTSKSRAMQSTYFDITHNPVFHCFSDFLALRKLIDGAGMVAHNHFSITQKPQAIDFRDLGSQTQHGKKKPLQQKDDRLEVRTGEGSKSDWATAFKLGLTSLVLRLVEHEKPPRHLKLYDPNAAILQIGRSPLAIVALASGERMRGIDVLKGIVDAAYEVGQKYEDLPAYEHQAYADFLQFYDDIQKISLKDHDVSALSDRIDWAARYAFFIRHGATYNSFTTDDLQQVQYDLLWDRIGDKDIARRWFSKFGHTALKVELTPPPHTRAETRVTLARKLYEKGELKQVVWETVTTTDGSMYGSSHPLDLTMSLREHRPFSYLGLLEEEE